jgi:hypothetical protein
MDIRSAATREVRLAAIKSFTQTITDAIYSERKTPLILYEWKHLCSTSTMQDFPE